MLRIVGGSDRAQADMHSLSLDRDTSIGISGIWYKYLDLSATLFY